jgi:adenosine deaminase
MTATIPEAFIRAIPKTDLHVHLDGSLRLPTLIELARQQGVEIPSTTESGLREIVFKDQYKDLFEYLQGFRYTVSVMQDAESVERIAFELVEDNLAEGVRYLETRFAPQLHMHESFSMQEVLEAVTRGMEKAKKQHNQTDAVKQGRDLPFHFGIIVCALRWFNPDMSTYYRNLFSVMAHAPQKHVFGTASLELARAAVKLRDEKGLPICGFDLAGAESGNPADDHQRAFQHAHSNFMKKTVHAGEAYGAESIFQALTECYATRLGHCTHLFSVDKIQRSGIADPEHYIEQLVNFIASQRITIEVNITSNLQTLPEIESAAQHPLRQMLESKLSATICTDNRLVSNTTVTDELLLVNEHIGLTPHQLRDLVIAGFKGSFFVGPYTEKRAYVRQVIDRYSELEREHFSEAL